MFSNCFLFAQFDNGGFYGDSQESNLDICEKAKGFSTDSQVRSLITRMVEKLGLKNRFEIKACSSIDNCQAAFYKGKPFILYNKAFLESVKSLQFTETKLKKVDVENWEVLTVLAHELGHHYDFHMTNPHPDKTPADLELEADEFAGRMLCSMGATLEQAQKVYLGNAVSDHGSFTHPSRENRLAAIARGWHAEDCGSAKIKRDRIDIEEFFSIGNPTINTCQLKEIEGEYECLDEKKIPVTFQSSIYQEINESTAFQISYSNVKNAEYHYLIENSRGAYRVTNVPMDNDQIILPNEEYQFTKESAKAEKIVLLLSNIFLDDSILEGLFEDSDNLLTIESILDYMELTMHEDYYDGIIVPFIFNM